MNYLFAELVKNILDVYLKNKTEGYSPLEYSYISVRTEGREKPFIVFCIIDENSKGDVVRQCMDDMSKTGFLRHIQWEIKQKEDPQKYERYLQVFFYFPPLVSVEEKTIGVGKIKSVYNG